MRILFLSLLVLATSCSMFQKSKKSQDEAKKKVEKEESFSKTLKSQTVQNRPGEVTILYADFHSSAKYVSFECEGKKLPHFKLKNRFYSLYPETYFSKLTPRACQASADNGQRKSITVEVVDKEFPAEELTVNRKRVFLNKKDLTRVKKERVFKDKVYASSAPYPYFSESFEYPIQSIVTSIYGSKRIFNKKRQTQHLGTDYRAPVGEEIFASNRGKIVMARDLFYTGNTVVIDHGLRIFTVYAHLSELKVREGDMVNRLDLIGLAGMTGRVTGPHLHWGILVNGFAVEGDSLVLESRKIFSEKE